MWEEHGIEDACASCALKTRVPDACATEKQGYGRKEEGESDTPKMSICSNEV